MNIGKFIWGVIVLVIGFIFLAINFGYLDSSVWAQIWKLWPILIIVIGVSIVSGAVAKWAQVVLSILVIIIVVAAIVLSVGPFEQVVTKKESKWSWGTGRSIETKTISEPVNEAAELSRIVIKTGAADINLSGGSSVLVNGEVKSNFLNTDIEREIKGKTDILTISTSSWRPSVFGGNNDWNLKLNEIVPVELVLETGAVDAKADLKNVNLRLFEVKSGASSYEIMLGDKSDLVKGEISLGASSLKLKVPKSSGIKITADAGVSSNNFSNGGLTKKDNIYETADYDKAAKKIDIKLKTGASSIELERY
jgi:hypothetical protein